MSRTDDRIDAPEISGWVDFLGGLVERHPAAWIRLGNLESRMLRAEIDETPIDRPIYVAGLARAGTTVMLELLAGHRDVATHRYRDFPPVLAPRAWNWFVDRAATGEPPARERAHRDRIKVTPESPEAFEEVVWMAFFEHLHDPDANAVLDADTHNPAFEAFYADHLRKLVAMRGGTRYLTKANYNITRLGYLRRMFPDARFVVPIRDPVWHVASLMKQHALFSRQGAADARITRHLQRSGHFEFGLDRRPVNAGDTAATARIAALWDAGREVEGWADYWAMMYGHVAALLDRERDLARAVHVLRYEDLCDDPAGTMRVVLRHCELDAGDLPDAAARRVSRPDYYAPAFDEEDIALIRERTNPVLERFY